MSGPLYISGVYEKHSQFGAIGGTNDDTDGHRGAAYTLSGKMKLAISGASNGNKQDGRGIGLRHNF